MKDADFGDIKSSLYKDDFECIIGHSVKMDKLYEIVLKILKDDNLPKKMLVYIRRRPTTFFIAIALCRKFMHVGMLLLGDGVLKKRERNLQLFQSRNALNLDRLWICVTTYGKSGEGLNCLGTSYVVLMEPGLSIELEKQAFGRVKRARQEFTPHLYQIVNIDNYPKQVRILRQEARTGVFHIDSL